MSTEYGVVSTGFNVKRLEDIKTEIETELRALFGDINTAPDTVFGQLIGTFAKQAASVWEKMEGVYFSQYPQSAEGVSLDNAAQINAISRLGPSRTLVQAIVEGAQGTVVPVDTQFSIVDEGDLFETIEAVTIDRADVAKTVISILTSDDGKTYQVGINGGTPYEVLASSQDENDIAEALKSAINTGESTITASVPTTPDGTLTLVGDLDTFGDATAFSVAVLIDDVDVSPGDSDIELTEIWSPVNSRAIDGGPILATINTLTVIETPVAGMDAVDNLVAGTIGNDTETDAELRLRRRGSLQVVGAGTVGSIIARLLQEVEGVSAVAIFENREDTPDANNRPGHSFETVVQGGVVSEIAEKIWKTKPAGIETTFGNSVTGITYQVLDSNDDLQDVNFSRPVDVFVHVKVTVDAFYDEESLPADWKNLIKQAVVDWGEFNLPLGRDLIIQRWYAPVYTIPGLGTVTIEHDVTPNAGDSPSWVSINEPIGSTSIANMDVDRVTVEGTP